LWVRLERMPKTTTGKIDRRQLPEPEPESERVEYVAPRTPIEEMVAEAWGEVLGVERVGAHDDFFRLGGHSLLATQVVNRLRQVCQVEIPLRVMFEAQTVSELAARLEQELGWQTAAKVEPIGRLEERRELPLSYAQQRLWFLEQLDGGGGGRHNIAAAVRLE